MARLDLPVTEITRAGADAAGSPGNADGHMFANRGREFLEVENVGAAARVVTVVTPRTIGGLDVAELVVNVPAGGRRLIGPFPGVTFDQPRASADAGKVYVNYEAGAAADYLVRCFRLPEA